MAVCWIATTSFAQHSLDYLLMDVVLDTNGDAYVQEMRSMYIGGYGTENYITFNNLQDGMELKGLSVSENGQAYEFDDYWVLNRSRREKTFHCGFNQTDSGTEVCWGVGEEGHHDYIVRYVITNLVRSYEESDGFNHSFYEAANPAAERAYVNIRAIKRNDALTYSADDIWALPCFQATTPQQWMMMNQIKDSVMPVARIEPVQTIQLENLQHPSAKAWAFGFYGMLDFTSDGAIRADNDETWLSEGNSIIVMAEFEKGLFQPAMKGGVDKFETVKERAFLDSDYSLEDEEDGTAKRASLAGGDSNTPVWVYNLLVFLLGGVVLLLVLLPVWLVVYGIIRLFWGKKIDQRKWEKKLSKLIGQKVADLPYHRDPPMDGKLTCSQRILTGMRPKERVGISQLIEAFMLRMLYKGTIQITTETTEKGKLRDVFQITPPASMKRAEESQDHKEILQLYHPYMRNAIQEKERKLGVQIDDEHLENLLHQLLYLSAGKDHLLQPDELKQYIEDHVMSIRPYARMVDYMVTADVPLKYLPKEGAKEVYGFYKFLKDFTLVNEREVSEVSLWKEYLVYASLYGMADEVRKGMKKLAPDVMKMDEITRMLLAVSTAGTSGVLIGSLIDTMQNSYRYVENFRTAEEIRAEKLAAAAAERAARARRYSGGGGRSSFGGGGGFSGGGGSGVR